jgi:hypothetical protein
MLDLERKYYAANSSRWLKEGPGKFVLIKGEALIGIYDDMTQALVAGATKFGMESFLVRAVGETEEAITVPALTLGLLSANNQRTVSG